MGRAPASLFFLETLNLKLETTKVMKYFTISEMLYSPTAVKRGIWNGCTRKEEDNLEALVDNVLDPLRERYGKAVHVSSGYRCPQLNTLIHGALQSQHLTGEAADIYTDAGPQGNLELARIIVALGRFDQVILENVPGTSLMPQWVHVSWKAPSTSSGHGATNRRQILKKVMGSNSYLVIGKEVLGL